MVTFDKLFQISWNKTNIIFISGPKLWNKLPNNIRNIDENEIIKVEIKKYLNENVINQEWYKLTLFLIR